MMFCHKCGNEVNQEDEYCQYCGCKLKHDGETKTVIDENMNNKAANPDRMNVGDSKNPDKHEAGKELYMPEMKDIKTGKGREYNEFFDELEKKYSHA